MVAIAITLVVLTLVFGAIEAKFPARAQRRWRRGITTDIAYWFFTPIVSRVLAVAAVVVVAVVMAGFAGVQLDLEHVRAFARRPTWANQQPVAVQLAIVLGVGDLTAYWLHRWFHRGWAWRFHAIHHSSVDLDWLSSLRLHPVNEMITRAVQAVVPLVMGFDPKLVAAYVPLVALYALTLHANVRWTFGPLRYVIASPAFHRWHHTSEAEGRDKNFAGLLPVWDLVFGTFYMPRDRQPEQFGVTEPVPSGLLGQLAWPFRRAR